MPNWDYILVAGILKIFTFFLYSQQENIYTKTKAKNMKRKRKKWNPHINPLPKKIKKLNTPYSYLKY